MIGRWIQITNLINTNKYFQKKHFFPGIKLNYTSMRHLIDVFALLVVFIMEIFVAHFVEISVPNCKLQAQQLSKYNKWNLT